MLSKNWKVWSMLATLIIMVAFFAQSVVPAFAAVVTITPGGIWNDTGGTRIQAHGGGLTKVGSTYYWFGEDKTNGANFQNVKCYSSTDLKNWTFVNNVLTLQSSGDLGPNRIVERPHVIYNASTSTYVMWMHIDNTSYSERKAGTAKSSTVCGNYTYLGSVKPLNHDSLDDDLFLDGTTGYFMSEDRTNTKLQLYQLSSDFLTIASLKSTLNQYEGPALAKVGSTYFMFGSHLTGWSTNDNQYTTATSLAGPWSAWQSFAPSGTNTCNSQTTNIVPIVGTSTTTYLFMADRWNSGNLTDSRYIWEPLTINGTTASITCHSSWDIDAVTGIWSNGTGATYYTITNRNSGKVVDVSNQATADGTRIEQYTSNGGANQKFQFVDAGSGYFTIVGQQSGKCMDVVSASTADGAQVEIWTCNGGQNQQFQWIATGSYYNIKVRNSGKCINVVGSSTANGALLEQRACGSGNSFQWSRQ